MSVSTAHEIGIAHYRGRAGGLYLGPRAAGHASSAHTISNARLTVFQEIRGRGERFAEIHYLSSLWDFCPGPFWPHPIMGVNRYFC
jgi:hypothetical protein